VRACRRALQAYPHLPVDPDALALLSGKEGPPPTAGEDVDTGHLQRPGQRAVQAYPYGLAR
jgi:hypothetical protein